MSTANPASVTRLSDRGSVLLCRCSQARLLPAETLDRALAVVSRSQVDLTVVDDLCGLAGRRDPALAALLGRKPLAIAACHQRAVRWLLQRTGFGPEPATTTLINLRTGPAGQVAAALTPLLHGAGEGSAAVSSLAAPDPWVPWFPVIDCERCSACGQCASFCLFGVYASSADGAPEVQQPASCKTNCPACARICPEAAIIFPKLHESPLNGDVVSDEAAEKARIKVDVASFLGDDIYAALAERRRKAQRRLLRKQAMEQALAERQRCACDGGECQDDSSGLVVLQPSPRPGSDR